MAFALPDIPHPHKKSYHRSLIIRTSILSSRSSTHLVLIGGGHSHAIALKLWGMQPLPGIRITLIADTPYAPYSGMLPGHVAGFYSFEACHIHLPPLAQFAGAHYIGDRAVGLDLQHDRVLLADGSPVDFDVLSINIGSTPSAITVPGAAKYAIPAKPVPRFLKAWQQVVAQVERAPAAPLCLGIVGGGAGGVELALTMHARLQQLLQQWGQSQENLEIHLVHAGAELMPGHSAAVRGRLQRLLVQRGIQLHLSERVCAVRSISDPTSSHPSFGYNPVQIECESGLSLECDRLFWVTNAAAPNWLHQSGLTTDSGGFVLVRNTLQSVSHPHIFAAGDIATILRHPHPKAGVFAVRQGKPLVENWRSLLLGKPLKPYIPQPQILALIGTGDGRAIASRGNWGLGPSSLLWWWKDRIDRAFMERFRNLS
jgi:pyridine nucleotide-disulfide oxidoreductase family protein